MSARAAAASARGMLEQSAEVRAEPRSPTRLWVLGTLALLGIAGLIALGVWQIERRAWKLALIERVEQRIHATPVAAPGPAQWATLTVANAEYLRVTVTGQFLDDRETLVQAVTTLGGGFWVMTPFRTDQGFTVLVNRGFVPPDRRDPTTRHVSGAESGVSAARAAGVGMPSAEQQTIIGLLRMTEPKGGFLRNNEPTANRWYSRDVAAIAQARDVADAAPYFIDAEASPIPGRFPVGGLTVVSFRNSHLLYALTWFSLALMLAWLAARIARQELGAR